MEVFMMLDDLGSYLDSSKLLAVILVALLVVFAGTVILNGGFSSAPVENNTTENVTGNVSENASVNNYTNTVIGNNSYGSVSKLGTYGNSSSDVKIALILGVDDENVSSNAVLTNLENNKDLKYGYDIYMVNALNDQNNNTNADASNSPSLNNISESLAKEYAVPDIIKGNYTCAVDIHSTNDSNSYVFVPLEDTVTSKYLVGYINDNTNVGKYKPDYASYTQYVSNPLIDANIASIVYVTNNYSNATSTEINDIIMAIDNFDFSNVMQYAQNDSDSSSNDYSDDTIVSSNDSSAYSNDSGSYDYNNTTSSSSDGNKEVTY